MSGAPAWLRAAVAAAPGEHPLAVAATAFPSAALRGPRSLAVTPEVVAAGPEEIRCGVLGLAGPASPLPAGMARELAALDEGSAAAGLIAALESTLLRHLVAAVRRRAVDDPAGERARLGRLVGCADPAAAACAGRLADGPTADGLAHLLARLAGCRVALRPACGGELPLHPDRDGRLGTRRLGQDLACGSAVADAQLGCRIELGPIPASAAPGLRPGGTQHARVLQAIAERLPASLRWEMRLRVAPGAPGLRLGEDLRLAGDPDETCELVARG
jgi:predicted component of type VI protein secretion system